MFCGAVFLFSDTEKALAKTLGEVGSQISDEDVKEVALNLSDYECSVDFSSGKVSLLDLPNGMTIKYNNAMDINGKKLDLTLNIQSIVKDVNAPHFVNIHRENKKLYVRLETPSGPITLAQIEIKYLITEHETNNPYSMPYYYGIIDPDASDYLFDTTQSTILYKPEGLQYDRDAYYAGKFEDYFIVDDTGVLIPDDEKPGYFNDGLLIVAPSQPASSFTFVINHKRSDTVIVPLIYTVDADFTIQYNLNGGENNLNNPSKYHTGDSINILDPPSRPNYIFKGWQEGNSISPNDVGNKTFTAIWEPLPYTVKFDKNSVLASGTMTDQSIPFDTETPLTTNTFTSNNMKFIGWNTKADGSGVSYTDEQSVVNLASAAGETLTLYAQWEGNPATITYQIREGDEDGGKLAFESADGEIGKPLGSDKVSDIDLTDGWMLDGYYIDDKKYSTDELAALVLEKDVVVEVRMFPDKIGNSNIENPADLANTIETPDNVDDRTQAIVAFVDEDGTVLNKQVVDLGDDAKAPTDPSQPNKTFDSWDKAFTNVQEDLTVTAQYKAPTSPAVPAEPNDQSVQQPAQQPVQQNPIQQVADAANDLIAKTGDNTFTVIGFMILVSLLGIGASRRFK